MSFGDLDERPAKKRRFFVEDEPVQEPSSPDDVLPASAEQDNIQNASTPGFDADLFASFVGESVPEDTLKRLQEASGNDIQRGRHKHPALAPWC